VDRTGDHGLRIANYHPRARVGDGGITNSVRRLSEAFARAGADPVIVYDGRGRPHRELGVQWWPVRHVGRDPGRLPLGLGQVIGSADVVVLNSAWTGANARAGALARRLEVPYVLAPRGAYDPLIMGRRRLTKKTWWLLFERRLVRGAAAIHVFFGSQGEHLSELGYRGAALVAPNGVEIPEDRRWDGGSGGYVAFLGRFDQEHKGLDLLLRAVASMPPEERPSLRLHGPDWRGGKARVRRLLSELDLGRQVELGPPLLGAEKWELLVRAVGFVYPSRWEGFGNSLAEAAAIGTPTLATPYPLARYLEERGACVVVDAEPAALADGLRELMRVAQDRSRAAVAPAEDLDLDWDSVAHSWLEQLAAGRTPGTVRR
jgi:glycosyltransferase involved in cell wall biosynthesis